MDLEGCFTLIVPSEPMSDTELATMFAQYDMAQKAQDDFLEGKISFSDYMEVAEMAEIEIDDYLEDIEVNLESRSLI